MILTSSGALGQASDVTVLKNWWSKYQNSEVGNNAWNSLLTLPFLFSLYTLFPYSFFVPLFHCNSSFKKSISTCWEIDCCCLCTSEKTHQTKTSFAPLKMMMIEVGDSRKRNEQATGWLIYQASLKILGDQKFSIISNKIWSYHLTQLGLLLFPRFNNYPMIILYSMMLSLDKINLLAR